MSDAERETMAEMKAVMDRFMDSMSPLAGKRGGGGEGFEWDARVAGYPIVSRCFRDGRRVLDLTMDSFDRSPVDSVLFELPKDYQRQDLSGSGKKMSRHERGQTKQRSR